MRRLFKRVLWALLALFGLLLAVLLAWIACNGRWADAAPRPVPPGLQPQAVTLAPQSNAFFDGQGLRAPAGVDPNAWGQRASRGEADSKAVLLPLPGGDDWRCNSARDDCVALWRAKLAELTAQMQSAPLFGERCHGLAAAKAFQEPVPPYRGTPPGSEPRLLLSGQDVTGRLTRGRLSAQLELRDQVLPGLQKGLDGFAQALTARFDNQGMTLFTDPAGAVPATAQPGFAQSIRVSAAMQATPAAVRDETGPAGPAGQSGLIERVLDRVLGSGTNSLAALARGISTTHAGLAADTASRFEVETGVQTALTAKLATATGVSVDAELADLVRLQNAYAANAKVLSVSQAAWSELLGAVR